MCSYKTYFDLSIIKDAEIAQPVLMGVAWRYVHQASVKASVPFAVAFPKREEGGFSLGGKLRIFTQDMAGSERLYDEIELRTGLTNIASLSRIYTAKDVNVFEAYMMKRIPSGVLKTHTNLEQEKIVQARAKLRRMAEQRSLPYVWMQSSTSNKFKLVIERVTVSADNKGKPNGYGLSRLSQIIALPVL